jgi:hypothetical protein
MAAVVFAFVLSCKKSSGGGSNTGGGGTKPDTSKSVLVKITLNPLPTISTGTFNGAIDGLLPNLKEPTWKVNGTVRPDEGTIAFTPDDFQGGILTLEATSNVNMAALTIGGGASSTYPYTVHIEPTINGKIKDSVTIKVTGAFSRQWSW